jgi:hypothetical protein
VSSLIHIVVLSLNLALTVAQKNHGLHRDSNR